MRTIRIIVADDPSGGFSVSVLEDEGAGGAAQVTEGHIEDPPPTLPTLPPDRAVLDVLQQLLTVEGDPPVPYVDAAHYLFGLLAVGDVRAWVERSAHDPPGTRRTLLDVRADRLRRLPWEMMTDPATGWAPFVRPTNPWARAFRNGADHPQLAPLVPPVRVLFVAGRVDDASLIADDEFDAIVRTLCRDPARWHVEDLIAPTRAQFEQLYREMRPHVLHIVAHGDRSRDGQPVLAMREGLSQPWSISPFTVSNMAVDAPRLVVLNACRSGVGTAGREAVWTFADTFLDRHSGAVVTMQGDIPSEAAIAFASGFYAALADGKPIDLAASAGRHGASGSSDEDPAVWGLPSLVVARPPEEVLPMAAERSANPRVAKEQVHAAGLVDHASERRNLWYRAAPETDTDQRRHVVVVTGPAEVGKSAVVRAALPACHVRGCDIAYVDFQGDRRLDWFRAVKRIHHHVEEWLPERTEALADFEHAVECLRQGPAVTPRPAGGGRRLDRQAPFVGLADSAEDRIDQIFQQVLALLRGCAGDRPLVLVLDHLTKGLSDEAREDHLLPRLVEPLAAGEIRQVTVVTVVESTEVLRGRIHPDLLAEAIEVRLFDRDRLTLLLHELYARRYTDQPMSRELHDLSGAMGTAMGQQFLPRQLVSIGEGFAPGGRR